MTLELSNEELNLLYFALDETVDRAFDYGTHDSEVKDECALRFKLYKHLDSDFWRKK